MSPGPFPQDRRTHSRAAAHQPGCIRAVGRTGRSPEEVPDDGVAHGVGGDLGAQLEEVLRADVGFVFGERQQPAEEPRLPHLPTAQPGPTRSQSAPAHTGTHTHTHRTDRGPHRHTHRIDSFQPLTRHRVIINISTKPVRRLFGDERAEASRCFKGIAVSRPNVQISLTPEPCNMNS